MAGAAGRCDAEGGKQSRQNRQHYGER